MSNFFESRMPSSPEANLLPPTPLPMEAPAPSQAPDVDFHSQVTQTNAPLVPESSDEVLVNSTVTPPQAGAPPSSVPNNEQETIFDPDAERHARSSSGDAVRPGTVLGDFRLDRKLGQGGMGEVYLATQVSLDRPVAVKLLPTQFATQDQFIERFEREAKSAASLVHPNVIQVYAYGIVDGAPYFAMEYVEGEDLHQRLTRCGQLPLNEIIEIMIGVSKALAAAGDKTIVHRDIKPSNIMLDNKGLIKVMDFGLAKAASMAGASLTQSGLIMGTPKYMSPEQAKGEEVGITTDIYSLGIVFYELLTGQLPFRSETPAGLIFKHVYEAPPAPSLKNSDIPPFLEEVVLRMMEKDPYERYPNCHEVIKDLKEFQNNKAYYLAGGSRRKEGDTAFTTVDGVNSTVSVQEQATKVDAATKVAPEKGGGGFRFFIIVLLLLAIGGGVAYFGHMEGHWTIPYLPPRPDNGKALTDAKDKKDKKQGDGKGKGKGKTDPETPIKAKKVRFLLNRKIERDIDMTWNGVTKTQFTVFTEGVPHQMEPGEYAVIFKKRGREDIHVDFKIDEKGVATVLGSNELLDKVALKFEPLPALKEGYAQGMKALKAGQFKDAIEGLKKANDLDPNYRLDNQMTVSEGLKKAKELLTKKTIDEKKWTVTWTNAQKDAKDKQWRSALKELKTIPADYSAFSEVEALKKSIADQIGKLDAARKEAATMIATGDCKKAVSTLNAVVQDDPADTEAPKLLKAAKEATTLLALGDDAYKKGLAFIENNDYSNGQKELVKAQKQFDVYLEKHGGKDTATREKRKSIATLLSKNSTLGDLVKQLNAAWTSKDYKRVVELAEAVLAKDADNEVAKEKRGKADRELKRAAVYKTLSALDKGLVAEDVKESLKSLMSGTAEYKKAVTELADFAKVATFTESKHEVVEGGFTFEAETVVVKTRWSFAVKYLELDRTARADRMKVLTFKREVQEGNERWLIVKISR